MTDADDLQPKLVDAIRHHEAGEIEQARDLYLEILDADPQHERALHLAGLLCLQCGEFEGAKVLLSAAADIDPRYAAGLARAAAAGVEVLAWDCAITRDRITLRRPLPVIV